MSFSVPFRWKIQRKTQSLLIVIRFLPFRLDMCLVLVKLLFFVSTHWMLYGMPGEWEWRWMQGWGNGVAIEWQTVLPQMNWETVINLPWFFRSRPILSHSLISFGCFCLQLLLCCCFGCHNVAVCMWVIEQAERTNETSKRALALPHLLSLLVLLYSFHVKSS